MPKKDGPHAAQVLAVYIVPVLVNAACQLFPLAAFMRSAQKSAHTPFAMSGLGAQTHADRLLSLT